MRLACNANQGIRRSRGSRGLYGQSSVLKTGLNWATCSGCIRVLETAKAVATFHYGGSVGNIGEIHP